MLFDRNQQISFHIISALTRCREAIESLRALNQDPLPRRFLYTPTIIPRDPKKAALLKNRSPMIQENNVHFELTCADPNESQRYQTLDPFLSEIVTALGADMKTLLKVKYIPNKHEKETDLPYSIMNEMEQEQEALPSSWSANVASQTEEMYCDKCISQSLKVHQHIGVQTIVNRTVSRECQTMDDDTMSLAEMTPAQLRAINDFSKILRGGLAPTTYREATDLRDRLYNIYQSCTGIAQNLYPRDNENRITRNNERSTSQTRSTASDDFNSRRDGPNNPGNNGILTSKQIIGGANVPRNRASDFFNTESDWEEPAGMSNSTIGGNVSNFGNNFNANNPMNTRGMANSGGSGNMDYRMGVGGGNINIDPRKERMGLGPGNMNRMGSGMGNMGNMDRMGPDNFERMVPGSGNMGHGPNNMDRMGLGNMDRMGPDNMDRMGPGSGNMGVGNIDPRLGGNFNPNSNFNNRGGNFNRGRNF